MTDDLYLAIGKIVRAVAEIDDILTLAISQLITVSESKTAVLLGRMQISRKIAVARMLAKMHDPDVSEIFTKVFEQPFSDIIDLRNALAHGTLLGVTEGGDLYFESPEIERTEGEAVVARARGWPISSILGWASQMDAYIQFFETGLQVQELRQGPSRREMQGHPKGRKKSNTQKHSGNPEG
ncbi:hypothetical protein [Hyphomonas oceanitis]|nr:hypothetical protein [Hyphomonas oceanitis]